MVPRAKKAKEEQIADLNLACKSSIGDPVSTIKHENVPSRRSAKLLDRIS